MNSEQFTEAVSDKYANIREVRKDVIRADLSHGGQRVSVHYFDFSNVIDSPSFDIEGYQSDLLAKDYYRDAAALQWNYYLHFILPEKDYAGLAESGFTAEIERNNLFARKDVLTLQEFKNSFGRDASNKKITGTIPVDPSLRWISTLRNEDLDGVYLDYYMSDVVKHYMKERPIKESSVKNGRKLKDQSYTLGKLENVTLDKYRDYPLDRDFKFADASLVYGVNGVGKTSLLESIELWCCGSTYRSSASKSENYRIGILFDGERKLKWSSNSNNELYRARDLSWYGNFYQRGNRLSTGFSRFNLYNSDAATKLTVKGELSEFDIANAFASLILGESANQIEERAIKIRSLFSQEEKQIDNIIFYLTSAVTDNNSRLKILKKRREEFQTSPDLLMEKLNKLGWIGIGPTPDLSNREIFEQELDVTLTYLGEIESLAGDIYPCNVAGISSQSKLANNISAAVSKELVAIKTTRDNQKLKKGKIRQHRELLEKLNSISKYVSHKSLDRLANLNNELSDVKKTVERLSRSRSLIENVELSSFIGNSSGIQDVVEAVELRTNELTEKQMGLLGILKEFEEHQGKLSAVTEEIRSLGRQFVELDPNATDCPLCRAQYEVGRLTQLLNSQIREFEKSEFIMRSYNEYTAISKDLAIVEKELNDLVIILKASSIYYDIEDLSNKSLTSIINDLDRIDEELHRNNELLDEIEGLVSHFDDYGLSGHEYGRLLRWLSEAFPETEFTYENRDAVDSTRTDLEQRLEVESAELERFEEDIRKSDEIIESNIRELPGVSVSPDAPSEAILGRIDRIDRALNLFKEVAKRIQITDDQQLTEIRLRTKEINQIWSSYSKHVAESRESGDLVRSIEEELEKKKEEIKNNKNRKERAKHAISVLDGLIKDDSKERHIQDYLDSNISEIFNTFSRIHVPHEFKSINIKDGIRIELTDNYGNPRSVSEISSGQRSALALAIFLTMNRQAVNAPKFMLLDDPVAYIDDLNALSFLDYLRELVLEDERQIIFSTANQKLANLFDKKFEFLGERYVRHNLTRN